MSNLLNLGIEIKQKTEQKSEVLKPEFHIGKSIPRAKQDAVLFRMTKQNRQLIKRAALDLDVPVQKILEEAVVDYFKKKTLKPPVFN